jgi:hypothetical protein
MNETTILWNHVPAQGGEPAKWVAHAPFGWAVVRDSDWTLFTLDYTKAVALPLCKADVQDIVQEVGGTCSSEEEAKDHARHLLLDAMSALYEKILDWQNEPETDPVPVPTWIMRGTQLTGSMLCSPIAASFIGPMSLAANWSTHSLNENQLAPAYRASVLLADSRYQVAYGVAPTLAHAVDQARGSLAEITEYRAEMLREWLRQRKPAAPTTYLDVLRQALASMPEIKDLAFAKPKVEVSLDGGEMLLRIPICLPESFSVENKRVFSGPLFCHTCGLPAVPFGGEDICLDPQHDHDEREPDRDDDGDDEDDEP